MEVRDQRTARLELERPTIDADDDGGEDDDGDDYADADDVGGSDSVEDDDAGR